MAQNDMLNVLTEKSVIWVHGEMCKLINALNVQMDKCIDGKLCENFAEYFTLLNHEKCTRKNLINLLSVRTEFLKRSVYFSGAKLYNELPVQIQQLYSFEKFRKIYKYIF